MTEVVLDGKKIKLPEINLKEMTVDSIDYNDELVDTIEFKPEELFENKYQFYSLEDTIEFKDDNDIHEK